MYLLFFGFIFRRQEDNQDVISDKSDCRELKMKVDVEWKGCERRM